MMKKMKEEMMKTTITRDETKDQIASHFANSTKKREGEENSIIISLSSRRKEREKIGGRRRERNKEKKSQRSDVSDGICFFFLSYKWEGGCRELLF